MCTHEAHGGCLVRCWDLYTDWLEVCGWSGVASMQGREDMVQRAEETGDGRRENELRNVGSIVRGQVS